MTTPPDDRPPRHEELLRQAMAEPARASAPHRPLPDPATLTEAFPDLEIGALIGRGGMGAVYRAVQKRLGRAVALKVLAPDLAADPEFGERFAREARTLAALTHPHILTVHDFGEANGVYFLITELVEGVDLRRLMELGRLSPAEALRITPQICQALQYAHEHGVVHRDIKPENILIDTEGQVKVADFGLAKIVGSDDPVALTASSAVVGTPQYMAPEQWRAGGRIDHRADIFALGVVLYEMLTGQLPIGSFDPPSKSRGVPAGLDQVVKRTLAQQPESRYQSAREVEDDVGREAAGIGRQAPPRRATRPARNSRLVKLPFAALGLLAVGAVACLALVAFMIQRQSVWASYLAAERSYQAAVAAVAESVANGTAWDRPVPVPPTREPSPSASMGHLGLAVAAAGLGLALVVMALGFWSVRRIRASGGGLHGMGIALFTAWLIPLAAVCTAVLAPIAGIRDADLRAIALVAFGLLLAAGSVAFLRWLHGRELARLADPEPEPMRYFSVAAGVVSGLLMVGGAGLWTTLLAPPAETVTRDRGPTPPAMLVGASREDVLERLGPPLSIVFTTDRMTWSYRDVAGVERPNALVFTGGIVERHDPEALVLAANEMPRTGPYLGQASGDLHRELQPELGLPIENVAAGGVVTWEYPGMLRVVISSGVVVGFSRD